MNASLRRQAAWTAATATAVVVLLLLGQRAADSRHVDMWTLTRDVAALADLKWYAGFFSNLGLMVWGGSIALGAFGWWLLRPDLRTRPLASALASYAAVGLMLGLDDMAQIHEEIVPGHLGLSEHWVFGTEALLLLAFLVLHRRVLARHVPILLPASLAGFAVSLGADLVDRWWMPPAILEDGAKLVGICLWAGTGAALLAAGACPAGGPPEPE